MTLLLISVLVALAAFARAFPARVELDLAVVVSRATRADGSRLAAVDLAAGLARETGLARGAGLAADDVVRGFLAAVADGFLAAVVDGFLAAVEEGFLALDGLLPESGGEGVVGAM